MAPWIEKLAPYVRAIPVVALTDFFVEWLVSSVGGEVEPPKEWPHTMAWSTCYSQGPDLYRPMLSVAVYVRRRSERESSSDALASRLMQLQIRGRARPTRCLARWRGAAAGREPDSYFGNETCEKNVWQRGPVCGHPLTIGVV
eukprot:3124357-Prymnesium_polylepis.2